MTLADAIRKGAMQREQCFYHAFREGRSCALGAAYEGLFGTSEATDNEVYTGLDVMFDAYRRAVMCPVGCGDTLQNEIDIVAHLNDVHRWTREAIADWVQSVEDAAR